MVREMKGSMIRKRRTGTEETGIWKGKRRRKRRFGTRRKGKTYLIFIIIFLSRKPLRHACF
jgi:hypothetical protein